MYSLKKEPYGVFIAFDGFVKPEIMSDWLQESQQIVPKLGKNFNVLVDMRQMMPLGKEAQATMEEGQRYYKTSGMKRSCVVLSSPTLTMQFMRIAKETGIYEWERYIDASKNPNWEQTAVEWLEKGIDPDDHHR